jgi:two-component sensor histidine kinase
LKIISLLVEDQLKGDLRIERSQGTEFVVRFNIDK